MRSAAASVAILGLLTILKGCAVLTSELPETLQIDGRYPSGVHYYLPKGMLTLTLTVNKDAATFRLTPEPLTYIADTSHRYYMQYRPRPDYSDVVQVKVHPQRGFLQLISANTTDETFQAVVSLAGALSALRLEAASSRLNEDRLANLVIDPTDEGEVLRAQNAFNKVVGDYAKLRAASVCTVDKDAKIILDVSKRALCDSYRKLSNVAPEQPYVVLLFERIDPLDSDSAVCKPGRRHAKVVRRHLPKVSTKPIVARAEADAPAKADCSVGLCYRPPEPYQLCMGVGKSLVRQVMLLPNEAPLVEIDIHRAFFINKVQEINFNTDGLLTSVKITKNSELEAISALPVAIFDAILTGLQVRVKIIDQQINEAKITKDLIEARAELEKQRAALEASYVRGARTSAVSASSVPRVTPSGTQAGKYLDSVEPAQ
jgi:hypothetical protein